MVNIQMPADTALLPREGCRYYLLSFPDLNRKEAAAALEFRLPTVYPGSMEAICQDFRILKSGKKNPNRTDLLVLVAEKIVLEEFRRAHPGKSPYVPLFHLLDTDHLDPGESLSLISSSGVTDTLKCTDEGQWEYRREQPDDFRTIREWSLSPSPQGKAVRRGYRGAFIPFFSEGKKKSPPALLKVSFIFLILLLAGTVYGHRVLASMETRSRELSRAIGLQGERINRRALLLSQIETIEDKIALLQRDPATDPWLFLNTITLHLPQQTGIIALSSTENLFSLELAGPDALKLGEALSRNPHFTETELQEIRVSSPGELPRYRIICRFMPGLDLLNPSLLEGEAE